MSKEGTIPVRPELCGDDELAYVRSRTPFVAGSGMMLDEAYCLAHLPLVAGDHPRVLPAKNGTYYNRGRHPLAFSLVLSIPGEALRHSDAYRELNTELRATPFARKIAWEILDQRRDKLHATVCGALGIEDPPSIRLEARTELASLGPIAIELRGLFSGNVNRGRLYSRVYPERRNGTNVLHAVQRSIRRPTTDLYVVGIWNLIDDLDAVEAEALGDLIERWWDRPLLRFEADHLWLLGACDDLVLDASISETIPLTSP